MAVLNHGHSLYVGIVILIFDEQSDLNDVRVIRYLGNYNMEREN